MFRAIGRIEDLWTEADDHDVYYIVGMMEIPRLSGAKDHIYFRSSFDETGYLMLQDRMVKLQNVEIKGSLRTYPTNSQYPKYRTVVYAREFNDTNDSPVNEYDQWVKVLSIKPSRKTPLGSYITDFTFIAPRHHGGGDKVSAVCWGKVAKSFQYNVKPGDTIRIKGRFQSRTYTKEVNETESAIVMINEVSVDYYETSKEANND